MSDWSSIEKVPESSIHSKLEEGSCNYKQDDPCQLGSTEFIQKPRWKMFIDSFKPPVVNHEFMEGMNEDEKKTYLDSLTVQHKGLKKRHMRMIAIGGSIGTGLFIGSGKALSTGGPASLVLAFALIGSMLFFTIQSLGELSVAFPIKGGFAAYSYRFIDPAWGFAMGWNYAILWLCVYPLELVAASLTTQFWNKDINPVAWVVPFWLFTSGINFVGAKGYGEAEFWFSLIKVVSVIGFIIFGIVMNTGGISGTPFIGSEYYHTPGAFNHGFKGLCSVFVTGAFSFTGTEMVGVASNETSNPRKTLPKAIKQVFWRIILFYIITLTVLGLIVPFDDPNLLNEHSESSASPFVIAIKRAGLPALASLFNVVILLAILSVSNCAIYACSRTLAGLATQNLAPKFLAQHDRSGRPIYSLIVSSAFGLLCLVSASSRQTIIFQWLMALTGLSSIFTWGSINLAHIRFRAAMKKQGKSLEELSFRALTGVWGSWIGLVINVAILALQFWTGLYPVGGDGKPDVASFFQAYLCAPIILICFIFWKIYKKTSFVSLKDMDIDTDRRQFDPAELKLEVEQERTEMRAKPLYKRIAHFWC